MVSKCNTCIKFNEFGGKGESGGLDSCHFPAKLTNYSDMSAELHVLAQIPPNFFVPR